MNNQDEGFAGIWLKPVDARRYAWTRLAFAAGALCQMIHLWRYRHGLFDSGGLFSEEVAKAYNPGLYLPKVLMIDVSWWPGLMIICGMLAAVLLFFGKWPRASLVIIFLILMSFIHRAPLATTGWDFVLTNFSFILIFSPLGAEWTPSRLWTSRKTNPLGRLKTDMVPRYGLVLLQIQVAVIYWQTVSARAGDKFWSNGDFMNYYLLSHHSRFAGPWVLEWDSVLVTATYLTSLVEVALPILLWIKTTRWIGVAIGLMFHLGLAAVSLNIGLFSLIMLMTYVPFIGGLPSNDWDDDQ